jgi:hypothetical protein
VPGVQFIAIMGFNIQYSIYAEFGKISKHQRAASQYHYHETGFYIVLPLGLHFIVLYRYYGMASLGSELIQSGNLILNKAIQ